jgi:SAM-dependent methyltransferase
LTGHCAACGGAALRLHLSVAHDDGASLVPTTSRYGSAPADLVRCGACGHIQVAELPGAASLDEGYAEAEDHAYLEEEDGQRATAALTLDRIERYTPVGVICDLGCWVGFLLAEAERRGWEVFGVEPSRFASELARERFGLEVVTATLEQADLPQARFEAVVLADVIEHLPDPGEALDVVAGLLRRGGVVYLALPDAGSGVARALGSRWWSVLPTHVQYFTRESVARLLVRHGYVVEWMGTAPKAFSVRYYLQRLEGYSPPVAAGAVDLAQRVGLADRLIWPDFRDRMGVVARYR